MPKNDKKDKKVQYEYKVIDCHSIPGIHYNKDLMEYIFNLYPNWRFHTFIAADGFGVYNCPLVILERIRE